MKTILNLVCALALVMVQCVFTAAPVFPSAASSSTCACCNCKRAKCCASQDLPDAPTAPAAPVPSQQHPDLRFAAADIIRLLPPTLPSSSPSEIASPDALSMGEVPLFTRDCARLL